MVIDLADPQDITAYNWMPTIDGLGTINNCHNIYIDEFGMAHLAGCNVNGGGLLYVDVTAPGGMPVYIDKGPPISNSPVKKAVPASTSPTKFKNVLILPVLILGLSNPLALTFAGIAPKCSGRTGYETSFHKLPSGVLNSASSPRSEVAGAIFIYSAGPTVLMV